MSEVIGFEAKLYYNTGTSQTPTWSEITRTRDVSVTMQKAEIELSRRETNWKLKRGGMLEVGFSFQYLYMKGTDAVWTALQAAWEQGTSTEFAIMDQDIATTGAQGLMAFSEVLNISYDQPLEDAQVHNFECVPTGRDETGALKPPQWHTVP